MPDRKSKNVTLRDVAKRVGVSAMTVSRALSAEDRLVNPKTAELCRQAAEELGYVPNLMARGLRGEKLNTIVLFAEFISSHHYLAELVDVVSRAIERRKHGVISCQSLASFHQAIGSFKLAGAAVIAPPESFFADPFGRVGTRARHGEPLVIIHSAFNQVRFNEVSPDIVGFTRQASDHLLDLGHEYLGFLGGARPEDEAHWFDLRRGAIEDTLRGRGLPSTNLWYQPCGDADLAATSLQQLLTRAPPTTAIMCINDEIAVAAAAAARRMGRRVPRDLSIMGCNDIELARFFEPPITTLNIDIHLMVETALDVLFDEICGRRSAAAEAPVKIKLPARLVVRESTGPPPTRQA